MRPAAPCHPAATLPREPPCYPATLLTAFHCSAQLGTLLPLNAGDDAAHVAWVDVGSERYENLYASHKAWVDAVAARMYGISSNSTARRVPAAAGSGSPRPSPLARLCGAGPPP